MCYDVLSSFNLFLLLLLSIFKTDLWVSFLVVQGPVTACAPTPDEKEKEHKKRKSYKEKEERRNELNHPLR